MTLQYITDVLLAPFLRGETEAWSSWVPCQGHTARKWQSGQRPSTLAGAQAAAGPWLGGIAELASFSEQQEGTARPTRARREARHCSLRARRKDTHCQPEKLGKGVGTAPSGHTLPGPDLRVGQEEPGGWQGPCSHHQGLVCRCY